MSEEENLRKIVKSYRKELKQKNDILVTLFMRCITLTHGLLCPYCEYKEACDKARERAYMNYIRDISREKENSK